MMVKGYLRYTAALPSLSNRRARPGWTGFRGCLVVSRTKTFDIAGSFCRRAASAYAGDVRLDKVMERFDANDTGLTR
jgi:hypothetical protein